MVGWTALQFLARLAHMSESQLAVTQETLVLLRMSLILQQAILGMFL